MRNYWTRALVAVCGVALSTSAVLAADQYDKAKTSDDQPVPQTLKTTDGRELSLVWNDEFNGEGLPDPDKWGFEVGYIRNNEKQYYTEKRLENVFQKDGALVIRTLKEDYPLDGKPNAKGRATADYTSGSIETKGKASWLYGRIDVRAKFSKGKGTWPAIWTLGDGPLGWPKGGEIDIMEYVGHTPQTSYATIHMHRANGKPYEVVSKGRNKVLDAPEEKFYVYSLEWTPEQLLLLIDDEVVLEFKRSEEEPKTDVWPFDKKQYLKLNAALGGGWGGEVAEGTCPTDFVVDYVRVYQ